MRLLVFTDTLFITVEVNCHKHVKGR